MPSAHKVCVLGAGISALSSAYAIAIENPGCDITVYSENFTPNTTSNHGFGIVALRALDRNFDSPNTPKWSMETFEYCRHLYENNEDQAKEMGITKVNGMVVIDRKRILEHEKEMMMYESPLLQLTAMSVKPTPAKVLREKGFSKRLNQFRAVFERDDVAKGDIGGCSFETFVIDNHSYLPWLTKELQLMVSTGKLAGVRFVKRKIVSFTEVFQEEFDVIVNAAGLAASYLVPDRNVVPIRGQYVLAKTSRPVDLYYGGHTFMCPKPGRVAVGSVYQVGRSDTAIDPVDTKDILNRASALDPILKSAIILKVDVGIRPARYGGPRVEVQWFKRGNGKHEIPVIHNYGHGAKGILQHWGTAKEVSRLYNSTFVILSKL